MLFAYYLLRASASGAKGRRSIGCAAGRGCRRQQTLLPPPPSTMESIESKARDWFDQGVSALTSHPCDLVGAISCFSRSVFLVPSAAGFQHRGEAFLRACDFRSALLNLRRAHAMSPESEPIRARLAQLHFIGGRLHLDAGGVSEAVRSFGEALALQPRNTDFWIFRIKAWIRGKSYGQALGELNRFIAHPTSEVYFVHPTTTTTQMPQTNSGGPVDSGSNVAHSGPHAAHRPHPSSFTDADGDGDFDYDAEDGGGGQGDGEFVADEGPLDLDSSSAVPAVLTDRGRATRLSLARTVQALILRAKLHVLLDRSDLALRDAGWAHRLAPGHAEVKALLESLAQKADFLYGSAMAHLLAGHAQHAITDLTRALELSPSQTKYYALRAQLLRQDQKYDDALRDLKQALSIAQTTRRAKRAKQRAEAKAAAAAAAGLDANSQSTAAEEQHTFVTAASEEDEDDDEEDDEKDEQQIELEKSLALTFNGLGVQYYQSGTSRAPARTRTRTRQSRHAVAHTFALLPPLLSSPRIGTVTSPTASVACRRRSSCRRVSECSSRIEAIVMKRLEKSKPP